MVSPGHPAYNRRMHTPMTILYTANLRGDLDLLPRLHTFIQAQRGPADATMLLDLGGSCDPAVWHCDVTGGRSVLLVLDAMGYDAANVAGTLTGASRARLQANMLGMQTLDTGEIVTRKGCVLSVAATLPERPAHHLHVCVSPAPVTTLADNTLRLAAVAAGQIGRVQVAPASGNGTWSLLATAILDLSPRTPPAPSIAATVDFVISEARYVQGKRGS